MAPAVGTKPPAIAAIVDHLASAGLVRRLPDPHDRRRIQVTTTSAAQPIVGDTDEDTAQRLSAVVHAFSAQTRRPLIDLVVNTVRRVTGTGQDTTASSPTAESQPLSASAEDSPSSEATAEA